ncbi:MAG: DPP IV N-terminal domain-containing protein [Thermomicrobiales bacterium]
MAERPAEATGTLSVEDIATYPLPGMVVPDSFAFSPDDRLLAYLHSPERSLTQQLFMRDLASGAEQVFVTPPAGGTTEATVSLEEALRRERQRQRAIGVTQFAWTGAGDQVLVPLQGALWVQNGPNAQLRQLVGGDPAPVLDAQSSPDGALIAYVQDAELYVVPAEGGEPRQLTHGARGSGQTHGLAEYIAQEEMGRSHGFWWSPDSQWLAFTAVDETHIPTYRIVHQGKDVTGVGAQEVHRYPFAGQPNAHVRLGVVAIAGGEPRWLDLGAEDGYLAGVDWFPDGALAVQWENRAQTRLDLLRVDPRTGERTPLLRETSDVWINLHDLFRPLKNATGELAGGFLWGSERTGFRRLYLYNSQGQLVRQLTSGDWQVDSLAGVDETRGLVYFTGTLDSPLERHLYVVPLAGGTPRRLTTAPGMHTITLDHAGERFVDTQHALARPPTVTLRALADGATQRVIFEQTDPRIARLALTPPELVTITAGDGTALYGAVYRPPARYGPGPFPAIVSVYGGPHAQRVTNGWNMTVSMREQYLREQGFLVFVLDNRGSARRGLAFEGAIRHQLGRIEVADQVTGVRWLVKRSLADPARVGVYGWSYGGYMALMCLATAPETFRVAVAGAPVTHWDGYDTHYTERYMGAPAENTAGYTASSVMAHVERITGHLLLVHGLIDENVHFRHTARLINALIRARKPYDLLLFPDERHMPRGLADRVYMEERIAAYFHEHM